MRIVISLARQALTLYAADGQLVRSYLVSTGEKGAGEARGSYRTPRGRHIITVCQGTACHVMGGKAILDYMAKLLDVKVGETTKDGVFTLERVACLGCCGMAPVVMIDNDFYGRCTVQKIDEVMENYP